MTQDQRQDSHADDISLDTTFVSALGTFLHSVVDDVIIPGLSKKIKKALTPKAKAPTNSKDQISFDLSEF